MSPFEHRVEKLLNGIQSDLVIIRAEVEYIKSDLNSLGVKADKGRVMMDKFADKLLDD